MVLCLAFLLSPPIEKKNTNYLRAIPIVVHICCTFYKLAQGASLIQCFESFTVGVTIVCKILHDVVYAINVEFRSQIQWHIGSQCLDVMNSF